MNSLNTEQETKKACLPYPLEVLHFNQNYLPKLSIDLKPLAGHNNRDHPELWYPPGHGDIYRSLKESGIVTELRNRGIKFMFISNSDNLGATLDTSLLQYMVDTQTEFMMEVVEKTIADRKGGTLIRYQNQIQLLEVAQVPEKYLSEFYQIDRFRFFNTNNIWLNLDYLPEAITMDVVYNPKTLSNGQSVVQLEIAMGSAIKNFTRSIVVKVDRSRFLPVKKCQDLFLVESNLFGLDQNRNMVCLTDSLPLVNFSNHYQKISDYQRAFPYGIPNISTLKSLTTTEFRIFTEASLVGDVSF